MARQALAQNPLPSYGEQRPEIDVCTTGGSVAVLPLTDQAKRYCAVTLAGWCSVHGIFFVPKLSSDLVLQQLTRRYVCRIDGELIA